MSALHPSGMCRCPSCRVESAVLFLESGRTAMALTLLKGLPAEVARVAQEGAERQALLEAEARELETRLATRRREIAGLDGAIAERRRDLARLDRDIASRQRDLARLRRLLPPRQPPSCARPYQRLAEALATGRVTAERVAALLKVEAADVGPIAAGRVGLGSSAWKRVLEVLA